MRDAAESHRLPARYMAQLVDYLESTGVDRAHVLRAARIRSLDDPKAQLTLRQVEALLRAAELASGRTDLGFELGRRLNPTSHDTLGFALLTCPTFGHVLRLMASYQRLIQPAFALRVQRRGGRVELVYLPVVALQHRSMRMFQEAITASNHFAFQSMLHGELPPYDVWLSIERPPHAERYRRTVAGPRPLRRRRTRRQDVAGRGVARHTAGNGQPAGHAGCRGAVQGDAAPHARPSPLGRVVPHDAA